VNASRDAEDEAPDFVISGAGEDWFVVFRGNSRDQVVLGKIHNPWGITRPGYVNSLLLKMAIYSEFSHE